MDTFNDLPLFTMAVDGTDTEHGVDFIALVDKPAIKKGWLAFREQTPPRMAFTVSKDRRIVSGPVMLADTPILRMPPEVPAACYVTFPPLAIENIVRKFFCQGNQANVNIMHDNGQQVDGVVMYESFIVDSERGILPMKGFEDAPEGSWFGSFTVNNDEVWTAIKEGRFTGFSVEGMFSRLIPLDAPELHTEQRGEGWWNDPDLDFTEEQRATLQAIWNTLKKVAA